MAPGERTSAKISDDADRIARLAPGDSENQILWRANLVTTRNGPASSGKISTDKSASRLESRDRGTDRDRSRNRRLSGPIDADLPRNAIWAVFVN